MVTGQSQFQTTTKSQASSQGDSGFWRVLQLAQYIMSSCSEIIDFIEGISADLIDEEFHICPCNEGLTCTLEDYGVDRIIIVQRVKNSIELFHQFLIQCIHRFGPVEAYRSDTIRDIGIYMLEHEILTTGNLFSKKRW